MNHQHPSRSTRAFSLVEAVVATAIAGVLFIAVMTAIGATARMRQFNEDNETAVRFAKDLLDEVVSKPYYDDLTPRTFGVDPGEKATRDMWDDVDDYAACVDSPASTPVGTRLTTQAGWSRTVTVEWVDPSNIETVVASDLGVKRVTVTASRFGRMRCTLTALRTSAWDTLMEAK